jgi:predicted heme/steroid binding protein
MLEPTEDEIRIRAYDIWESEGWSEGRHEEHWHQACQDLRQHGSAAEHAEGCHSSEVAADRPAKGALQARRGFGRKQLRHSVSRLRDRLSLPTAKVGRLLGAFAHLLTRDVIADTRLGGHSRG